MAKQSFADIFEQWERMQEEDASRKAAQGKRNKQESKDNKTIKNCNSSVRIDQSFGDIYSRWEQTHDEDEAISKRARTPSEKTTSEISINAVRRMDAQDELDLHEMKLEAAVQATREFLDASYRHGLRKVRIITGKGLHSKGGEAVLRPAVLEECRNHPNVREVTVPKAAEGGSGALTVIFKMH